MKTLEDCKETIENAGPAPAEKPLAQADEDGFTAWEMMEMLGTRRELWA